jgi:flagellar biosynthetic protein FlhB
LIGAVVANLAQVGFLFLPERVAPELGRISPLAGLRRLFSLSSTARLGFGLLKILVIGAVAWIDLYAKRDVILGLGGASPIEIASFLLGVLLWTSLKIALALLVLAVLDYALVRWKFERDLKMTTQELREELKSIEGDPQLRRRRRRVARRLSEARLVQTVPKADLVLTGPGSLALAIRYDPAMMAAPIVVAKGTGVLAGRIRQLALTGGVAQVEKGPLARALHREVDVGRPIPHGYYAQVAELLADILQTRDRDVSVRVAGP